MNTKPCLLILSKTCLTVLDTHREWLATQDVEVVTSLAQCQISLEQFEEEATGAHAYILPASVPILPAHMAANSTLQVLSIAASGYEWLDIEAATRCGIVVTNAPAREGVEVVADATWGLILAVARQIPDHHQRASTGHYQRSMGVSVWGKTLGIVGLGNIGKAVARRARGFDMPVLATTRNPDMSFVRQQGIELVALEELLRNADFVSLHLRLTPETSGIIGARELGWLKPSAYLINTARHQLVDEMALTEALLAGHIAGAAVDERPQDRESPLRELPNFVRTPHIGNYAVEGARAVCRCALENALAVMQGRRPDYVLNPQVYAGPLRAPRPSNTP
jgi:phosphoglycerate dehydrogenase-like enzyme